MGTKPITARELREFFGAFGVKPIDLTLSKEPGWDLRERLEGVRKQMVERDDDTLKEVLNRTNWL